MIVSSCKLSQQVGLVTYLLRLLAIPLLLLLLHQHAHHLLLVHIATLRSPQKLQ